MKHGAVVYAAKGCRACHEIGYQGQLAIFEYLEFDGKIRQLCASGASPSELQEHAVTKRHGHHARGGMGAGPLGTNDHR